MAVLCQQLRTAHIVWLTGSGTGLVFDGSASYGISAAGARAGCLQQAIEPVGSQCQAFSQQHSPMLCQQMLRWGVHTTGCADTASSGSEEALRASIILVAQALPSPELLLSALTASLCSRGSLCRCPCRHEQALLCVSDPFQQPALWQTKGGLIRRPQVQQFAWAGPAAVATLDHPAKLMVNAGLDCRAEVLCLICGWQGKSLLVRTQYYWAQDASFLSQFHAHSTRPQRGHACV
jgi:hypothetical protein